MDVLKAAVVGRGFGAYVLPWIPATAAFKMLCFGGALKASAGSGFLSISPFLADAFKVSSKCR